jgi:hypothetical protein
MLRVGPYGLTLEELENSPHGVDLGPHRPRLPELLRTPSGKVELAPPAIAADVERLRAALAREHNGGIVLIGRRQLRSNNSWMHNLPALVKGKARCTLHIHPRTPPAWAWRMATTHGSAPQWARSRSPSS